MAAGAPVPAVRTTGAVMARRVRDHRGQRPGGALDGGERGGEGGQR
jgi:hypothetical protein